MPAQSRNGGRGSSTGSKSAINPSEGEPICAGTTARISLIREIRGEIDRSGCGASTQRYGPEPWSANCGGIHGTSGSPRLISILCGTRALGDNTQANDLHSQKNRAARCARDFSLVGLFVRRRLDWSAPARCLARGSECSIPILHPGCPCPRRRTRCHRPRRPTGCRRPSCRRECRRRHRPRR